MIQRGGVKQGLECGAGFPFPEIPAFDATGGEAGAGGEAGGADHRGQRVLASPDRRPPESCGDAFCEVLRVEHRDRASVGAAGGDAAGGAPG